MPVNEIVVVSTSQDRSRFIDIGEFSGNIAFTGNLWNDLSAAVWTATSARKRLQKLVKNPQSSMVVARSLFWEAIGRITEADMYKAIPFNNGPPKTPLEVYKGSIKLLMNAVKIEQAAPKTAESTKYLAATYGTLARVYRSLYFELKIK